MDLQLKPKTAFVSGSTQGIGFAIARKLLLEGARVINGRTREKINDAIQKLKGEIPVAKVSGVADDFADVEEVNALLTELLQIDSLVNNVGIFELREFAEIRDEDWAKFFEVNVMSGVRLSRSLLPGMLARNQGRIIFNGVAATVEQIAGAQKMSVEQTKEYLVKGLSPTSQVQRFIDPAEIAHLAVYLSSPLPLPTVQPFAPMAGCSLRFNRVQVRGCYSAVSQAVEDKKYRIMKPFQYIYLK
jgi:NADP-dependent 3-hydroxy acid dehydrogenase YdfG